MFDVQPERIVSAAIQKDDLIIMGVRHFDQIMQNQLEIAGLDRKGWTQGFITNKLRFVSREEAWEIAKANDQICWGKDRPPGKLFSEDLY
jgi:hypothetical protein